MNRLQFLGAAREVTGSCYLVEAGTRRILLDCGMHQGGDAVDRLATECFDFDPGQIDAVVLSHAHLDHSGLLPRLVNCGFSGPIFCTEGTHRLLKILLEDAASIYFRDLEYDNLARRRAGKRPREALYSAEDVVRVLKACRPMAYHQQREVVAWVGLRFFDAGHILGSAIVELTLSDDTGERVLVFSGDLGNPETSLMPHYETLERADLVLMESTYGARDHRPMDETLDELRAVIRRAAAEGGNVLIPAFAVGRTQELLFHLGELYQEGLLKDWQVFLDSPMGHAVTEVYARSPEHLDRGDVATITRNGNGHIRDFLPNLSITESVDDSIAINKVREGAIIIAGSGMCTGGRIRHHLKHRLWESRNHLVFAGFQAKGTLGRILIDGVPKVKLFGQWIVVKAQIHTLGGFSAHAGQRDLLHWASCFRNEPRIYLVHGEIAGMEVLQETLWREHGIRAEIPELRQVVEF
ncbi:MAG: MBL fold metallo-hydrolase [Porticoccaceae bacterium]|jgi:metallo-beta-lactamase family protein|nr:MBL fold metallo-hydrolase [Porticoccaceae bacterium]HLS99798.1 MBL fold metallo-hydrolase [Porticoccaceae bacterium]